MACGRKDIIPEVSLRVGKPMVPKIGYNSANEQVINNLDKSFLTTFSTG